MICKSHRKFSNQSGRRPQYIYNPHRKMWEQMRTKIRVIEDNGINKNAIVYVAVFNGFIISLFQFPQFALWATNIMPSSMAKMN